jgi:opacity protein-like surface antigen
MKPRIALLALLALLLSSAGFAQVRRGTVEISPFAGYLFGGKFARGTTELFTSDVDVDDHATYGLRLGYNVTSKFEVELQASRTETAFVTRDKGKLFGNSTSAKLGDLDIDYLLGNMTFNFGHRRAVPYITVGGGVARLSPSVPGTNASREYKGTGTLGAGVKVFFNPNFGLRFDGRYYATWIRDDNNNDRRDRCDRTFHDCSDRRDWLTNGDVTGGVVFAF